MTSNELRRLLAYARPYSGHLLISVFLMACVGASQALTARLIVPIFDRVLNPQSADAPVKLFNIPGFNHDVYLDAFMPSGIHNVWTMVAVGILARPVAAATVEGKRRRWGGWSMGSGGCVRSKGGASRLRVIGGGGSNKYTGL